MVARSTFACASRYALCALYSTVAPVLLGPVLLAPVLLAPVLLAPVLRG